MALVPYKKQQKKKEEKSLITNRTTTTTTTTDEFDAVYNILLAFEYDRDTKACDMHSIPAATLLLTNKLYKPLHANVNKFKLYVKTSTSVTTNIALPIPELLRLYFDVVFDKSGTVDFRKKFVTVYALLQTVLDFVKYESVTDTVDSSRL